MPTLQNSVSIAAGVTSDVLSGALNSIVPPNVRGASVRYSYTGSATGLTAEGWVGTRNVIESGAVSTQNRIPIIPDDIVEQQIPAWPNERLQLKVTNTTAGALTFFYRVTVDLY